MRLTEILVAKKPILEDQSTRPSLKGVPAAITERFMRGLDDVKHGRVVSIDSAVTEGRRRIAQYRANKNNDQTLRQRKRPIS